MQLKYLCMSVALAVTMAASTAASAATYLLTFTDTSSNVDAVIKLTTGAALGGGLAVTSATGEIDGVAATLLGTASATEVTSPSGYFFYDDLLFPTASPTNLAVDNPGLLFSSGGQEWNIFSQGGAPGTDLLYSNSGYNVGGDLTLVAVPEPATWGLMLLGAGLMGAGLRTMRVRRGVVAA